MKLMRIGERGSEKPVVEVDGRYLDASSVVEDITPAVWGKPLEAVRRAVDEGKLPEVSLEGQRIGSPVSTAPSVICIGQNYAEHAAESGNEPPKEPIIFFKTPNTITGPYDAVGLPPTSEKSDWEVELGVVIGKQAAYLSSREEAADAIGGYVLANDLSERDFQFEVSGGQWSKGKCIKDYMPLGPVLALSEDYDPHAKSIRSWVNGEPRQDSNTRDMIFDVAEIVLHLSQYMQLEPGDVISTGTPQGVALSGRFPYLTDEDVVEVEIEGLGKQRQELFRIGARA